jgi:hypothetical protein
MRQQQQQQAMIMNDSSSSTIEETSIVLRTSSNHRRERRRQNKERSVSSLSGMFANENEASNPMLMMTATMEEDPNSPFSEHAEQPSSPSQQQEDDRQDHDAELISMVTRKLRRAKRRLFLQSVLQPPNTTSSVDRFRRLLLRLSSDENMGSSGSGHTSSSARSMCSRTSSRSVKFDDDSSIQG